MKTTAYIITALLAARICVAGDRVDSKPAPQRRAPGSDAVRRVELDRTLDDAGTGELDAQARQASSTLDLAPALDAALDRPVPSAVVAHSPQNGALRPQTASGAAAASVPLHPGAASAVRKSPAGGLMDHIDFDGSAAERAAIADGVERMMQGAVASALTQEYLRAGDERPRVAFVDMPDSYVVEMEGGKKALFGRMAQANNAESYARISLNRKLLELDPSMRPSVPAFLAHELLGHRVLHLRFRKTGLPEDRLHFYGGDELRARIVGYLGGIESGDKGLVEGGRYWQYRGDAPPQLVFGEMWRYLSDPGGFRDGLGRSHPAYAAGLTPEQMTSPQSILAAWAERSAKAAQRVSKVLADYTAYQRAGDVMDHLVAARGLDPAPFGELRTDIKESAEEGADISKSAQTVQKRLARISLDAALIDSLTAIAGHSFFADTEREIAVLDQILRVVIEQRGLKPSPPLETPGQLGWPQFYELYQRDKREHPADYTEWARFQRRRAGDTIAAVDAIEEGGGAVIKSKADLASFVERPLLAAAERFYDKNVRMTWSSANKKDLEFAREDGRHYAYFHIDAKDGALSPENLMVAAALPQTFPGVLVERIKSLRGLSVDEFGVSIPITKETTVGELSALAARIADSFKAQDIVRLGLKPEEFMAAWGVSLAEWRAMTAAELETFGYRFDVGSNRLLRPDQQEKRLVDLRGRR